jgi:hypothetical protein
MTHASRHGRRGAPGRSAAALGLYPSSPAGRAEGARAAAHLPFALRYPTLQTGQSEQQSVRAYALPDQQGHAHHAYVAVWRQSGLGGYYDLEGSDWLTPPLFAHAREQTIAGRPYRLVEDGSHIHVIGWRSGRALYWLTNTLLEELSNAQMIALAQSVKALH